MTTNKTGTTKTALIMAGGTGGHIFPGLALAERLMQDGWRVEWMGTRDRMEAEIVPKHDIKIHFIEVKGIRGNGVVRKLALPFMLLKAIWQARSILKKLKPSLVIGFGGYASGPGGIAAKSLGIPLMIHEQNAVLGMTNRWLSKLANKTCLAFPLNGSKLDAEVVGNPVRQAIVELGANVKSQHVENEQFKVLVIGGSLGARALNQTLPEVFSELAKQFHLSIRHQTGKGNHKSVELSYSEWSENMNSLQVQVDEFIDDIPAALSWSDLVICRAGALTVSELAASGNVGIFIPLPHAVDDHQTANANWLVKQGAGVLIPQAKIGDELGPVLTELFAEPDRIHSMQEQCRTLPKIDTVARMAQLCQELEVSS